MHDLATIKRLNNEAVNNWLNENEENTMEIEFDCGTIAPNVGVLSMALKAHLEVCVDEACKQDVLDNIKKFG